MCRVDASMSVSEDLYLHPDDRDGSIFPHFDMNAPKPRRPSQADMQIPPTPPTGGPIEQRSFQALEALRERAYTLARQELPDAPVEDVLCRAEKIAAFLRSGG